MATSLNNSGNCLPIAKQLDDAARAFREAVDIAQGVGTFPELAAASRAFEVSQ